jgi:hypothetical protein
MILPCKWSPFIFSTKLLCFFSVLFVLYASPYSAWFYYHQSNTLWCVQIMSYNCVVFFSFQPFLWKPTYRDPWHSNLQLPYPFYVVWVVPKNLAEAQVNCINIKIFDGVESMPLCQIPNLQDYLWSSVHGCLLNIFVDTLHLLCYGDEGTTEYGTWNLEPQSLTCNRCYLTLLGGIPNETLFRTEYFIVQFAHKGDLIPWAWQSGNFVAYLGKVTGHSMFMMMSKVYLDPNSLLFDWDQF